MSAERPSPTSYLWNVSLDDRRLRVICEVCSTQIGFVAVTPHGPRWVGLLGNRRNRTSREQMFHLRNGYNLVTNWVESQVPHYYGECQCPRNSTPGRPVWEAWLAQQTKLEVPAQE